MSHIFSVPRRRAMLTGLAGLTGLAVALLSNLLASPAAIAAEPMDFSLSSLSGEQQRLSDYRGRWVVVNYWATWCPPCLKELPELDLFNESHKEDAVVLGINFEDISSEDLQQFIAEQFLSFPMFRARPSRNTPFGPLSGLPTTYLLDPAGVPVAMHTGGITADMLESFIENYTPEQATQDKTTASPTVSPNSPPSHNPPKQDQAAE